MTRKTQVLLILTTAAVSAAVTLLAIKMFENEPPVEGAVPATIWSAILREDREVPAFTFRKATTTQTRRGGFR